MRGEQCCAVFLQLVSNSTNTMISIALAAFSSFISFHVVPASPADQHAMTSVLEVVAMDPPVTLVVNRDFSPEAEDWMNELLNLNPNAVPVVVGDGIAVADHRGLTLPSEPAPEGIEINPPPR